MGRDALIFVFLLGWYVCVRSIIFYYFIAAPRDNVDWWTSWLVAIPVTLISLMLIQGAFVFILYAMF
jgi:hypothetical protein